MSFELETPTKAKVLEVFVLSQKNRQPDENPGAKLTLQALLANDVLSTIDGALKGVLFTRDGTPRPQDKQATLDGVEVVSDMPNLSSVGAHVKTLKWVDELSGYRLSIDHGTGGRSNILVDDCKLSNFKIGPQPGGTVQIKFDLESPNVSEKTWGKLAKMKSCEVEITLLAPSIDQQQSIDDGARDDPNWPFPDKAAGGAPAQSGTVEHLPASRKAKGDAATDAFVAAHGNG
jgi:hypothetical protein